MSRGKTDDGWKEEHRRGNRNIALLGDYVREEITDRESDIYSQC